MSLFLQLAFLLSIILLSAKMAGYISTRFGQPSVLGELLVGIFLGPSLINLLNLSFIEHELTETVIKLGELGVLLLMFLAGWGSRQPLYVWCDRPSVVDCKVGCPRAFLER